MPQMSRSRRAFLKRMRGRKMREYSRAEIDNLIFLAELGIDHDADRKFQRMALAYLAGKDKELAASTPTQG